DIAMEELFKGPLQFFRRYTPSIATDKPSARFEVKGGIGYWRDMWVSINRRPAVKPL
ncbi:hypothetical protein AFLA_007358, partial [Aspergillus flavus NRRL3357]